MSDPGDNNAVGSPKVQIGRACDHCRSRKIRCDRSTPCANCVTVGMACRTSKDRPQVQRQRVLISGKYEQKIDAMEARLHGVETILLETNKMLSTLLGKASSSLNPMARVGVFDRVKDKHFNKPFDGETSLMAHSKKARHVIEHLLQLTPSMSSDPEAVDALKTLHAVMQGPSTTDTSLLQPFKDDDSPNFSLDDLPPQEAVLEILRGVQAADCLFFFIWYPFFTPAEFVRLCDQLYTDFDSCSLAIKTTLCGSLHYMFVEYLSSCKMPYGSIYWSYTQSFKLHFEACLRRYSVLSSPTFDNILALVFGTGHAIQASDYASAWPLVSAAANMCQALGWHRLPDDRIDDIESRRILFWLTYYFDKCLSLRLGRSSNIHDFDLSVSYPKEPDRLEYRSWHSWFLILIEIAAAHSLIYEHLFSPGAMNHSSIQRSQRVLELATRLDNVSSKFSGIIDATVYRSQYMTYLVKSNAVVIGCLRTLIFRAASLSEQHDDFGLDPRCLLAARSTLSSHQEVVEYIHSIHDGSGTDYANWVILNCPFTPFIVLFCHVIVSFDLDDLKLMEAFTISLESLDLRTAKSMITFRVLCEAFLLLATRYIRMSTRNIQLQESSLNPSPRATHSTPSSSNTKTNQTPTSGADSMHGDNDLSGFEFLPAGVFENWLSGNQGFG